MPADISNTRFTKMPMTGNHRTVIVGLAILLLGCTPLLQAQDTGSGDVAATNTEDDRVNRFLDAVFEREVDLSPIRQSTLGRKTPQQGRWDDFSDRAAAARIRRIENDIQQLRENYDYEKLGDAARLSVDLFFRTSERSIRNFEFRKQRYVVDQFNGQITGLITVLQNNHRINSIQDAEDYISRIAGLEDVLREFVSQLRDRADFGVIAPAFSFADVLNDARSMSTGTPIDEATEDNMVYNDFRGKLDALAISSDQAEDLLAGASNALRGPYKNGFTALIDELERQRRLANGDRGVWSLPDGQRYYQNRIREHTTLELMADEIHSIGLADVARIHQEMRALKDSIGYPGPLREFFDFIREDPDNYYEDSDAGREQFLSDARRQVEKIYEVVDGYFHTLPKALLEVRRVELWRENSTSIAFYNRPSEDGSRPGIYYANLADMASVQKYVFSAITYHESVPGHHFQIALAQELIGLPKFRKYGGYGAFTEGWALYAEQLAKEMGFYTDPYHDFGRLQNELWRSARLVIDTGIHAMRWTRDEAIEYFRENTPLSEGDIVTEVERFFVNPGQALSYKLGMMKILELRDRARSELGERFDIRDFHNAVIGAGSLPLSVLELQVEKYIAPSK